MRFRVEMILFTSFLVPLASGLGIGFSSFGAAQATEEISGTTPVSELGHLSQLSRDTAREIEDLSPEVLSVSDFELLMKSLESSHYFSAQTNQSHLAAQLALPRLRRIATELQARRKIRMIAPDQLLELGSTYSELRALYIPLTGQILISSNLAGEARLGALYHELKHAYQYEYRFGLDAAGLTQLERERKTNGGPIEEILNYLYETQSNYHTLQRHGDQLWDHLVYSKENSSQISNNWVQGTALGIGLYGNPWLILLIPFGQTYENYRANQLLPKIDQRSPIGINLIYSPREAALSLTELVPTSSPPKHYFSSGYAFGFQARYSRAIARTYFPLNPGLAPVYDERTLRIFNTLHDTYYERVGTSKVIDEDVWCQSLLYRMETSETSPILEWLALSSEEIEACAPFRGLNIAQELVTWRSKILSSPDVTSSFVLKPRPGGTGSRPAMRIQPALPVQE